MSGNTSHIRARGVVCHLTGLTTACTMIRGEWEEWYIDILAREAALLC